MRRALRALRGSWGAVRGWVEWVLDDRRRYAEEHGDDPTGWG